MVHFEEGRPEDGSPARPYRNSGDGNSRSPNQKLSSRITTFHDINYYNDPSPTSPSSPSKRGRESMVSLPTQPSFTPDLGRRNSTTSPKWSNPFSPRGYEPMAGLAADELSQARAAPVGVGRLRSYTANSVAETISEGRESIDLELIPAAAPMGIAEQPGQDSEYTRRGNGEVPVDWTSSLGPLSGHNKEFVKVLQEQEQAGKLTGGLGAGFKPSTTIREADLLATSSTVERMPTRTFSRRRGPGLSRTLTRKALAQGEADRLGEPIKVIIEDSEKEDLPSDSVVDISGLTETTNFPRIQSNTFTMKPQRTEIFYPQPDWKPFSMRRPYLVTLVVLSMVLAGVQEIIYQSSVKSPLVKFHKPNDISPGVYFSIKFLPTIFAVTYGVLWQITGSEVQRLEAYYQLSKEGGATAGRSLNVDYIGQFNFLRPIRAFQMRHYAVAVSSVASLLAVSLVPTLSAASIVLFPDQDRRQADPAIEKDILVNSVYSRLLTVTLLVNAVLGCVLFYQLSSRRSGLLADVKGIAGLAAMANVSHILMDFKDMDVATHEDIHHKLKNHRYVLRNSSLAPHEQPVLKGNEIEKGEPNHLSRNPHPFILRSRGSIPFIIGIVIFMVLIPVFLFTAAGYLTDEAPWILTALAVAIKFAWGAVDTNVRMLEPFYILSRRRALPKTLTLDYTAMPFAWVAFKALFNGHVLVFLVAFGTIMTEILTVLVTSLATVEGRGFIQQQPTSSSTTSSHGLNGHGSSQPASGGGQIFDPGQETGPSFWISLSLVIFILLYMAVVATIVFWRRRHPFLPRQPNTIASILAFIHQSKMLYDFVGTEKLSNREMVRTLEGINKTYGLGWFEGRDGESHCGVDQEELMSSYRHGVDFSLANKPWVEEPHEWL